MKKFKPIIHKAKCCNSEVVSYIQGHFSTCDCGRSYIDQTSGYTRFSGNLMEVEPLDDRFNKGAVYYSEKKNYSIIVTLIINPKYVLLASGGSYLGFTPEQTEDFLIDNEFELIGYL